MTIPTQRTDRAQRLRLMGSPARRLTMARLQTIICRRTDLEKFIAASTRFNILMNELAAEFDAVDRNTRHDDRSVRATAYARCTKMTAVYWSP